MERFMRIKKALLVTSLFTASAQAGEFDSLQIDGSTCNLVKSGSFNKDVVYSGEETTIGCEVVITKEDFRKSYSYCALSGIYSTNVSSVCNFGSYDASGTKVAFSADKRSVCTFTCIKP